MAATVETRNLANIGEDHNELNGKSTLEGDATDDTIKEKGNDRADDTATTEMSHDVPLLEEIRRESAENLKGDNDNDDRTEMSNDTMNEIMSKEDDDTPEAWFLKDTAKIHERLAIQMAVQDSVPNVEDWEQVSVLGEGQFGDVGLVQAELIILPMEHYKRKKRLKQQQEEAEPELLQDPDVKPQSYKFALKRQDKHDDERCEDTEYYIRKEIEILQELQHHPFVCDLVHTYEDDSSIFMLLGAIGGGELWDMIHDIDEEDGDCGRPDPSRPGLVGGESQAKFYALVLADTLAYLHSKRIVFRDFKPENVLMDDDGYPVLVDFGYAKELTMSMCDGDDSPSYKTYTFCGTPQYMAPEVVDTEMGHDWGVDHWALGVVIYEMISGEHPFYEEEMETSELFRLISDSPYYPLKSSLNPSAQVVSLLNGLMTKDYTQRLGSGTSNTGSAYDDDERAPSSQEILTNPWFDGLNLGKLRQKQVKAPWRPGEPFSTAASYVITVAATSSAETATNTTTSTALEVHAAQTEGKPEAGAVTSSPDEKEEDNGQQQKQAGKDEDNDNVMPTPSASVDENSTLHAKRRKIANKRGSGASADTSEAEISYTVPSRTLSLDSINEGNVATTVLSREQSMDSIDELNVSTTVFSRHASLDAIDLLQLDEPPDPRASAPTTRHGSIRALASLSSSRKSFLSKRRSAKMAMSHSSHAGYASAQATSSRSDGPAGSVTHHGRIQRIETDSDDEATLTSFCNDGDNPLIEPIDDGENEQSIDPRSATTTEPISASGGGVNDDGHEDNEGKVNDVVGKSADADEMHQVQKVTTTLRSRSHLRQTGSQDDEAENGENDPLLPPQQEYGSASTDGDAACVTPMKQSVRRTQNFVVSKLQEHRWLAAGALLSGLVVLFLLPNCFNKKDVTS